MVNGQVEYTIGRAAGREIVRVRAVVEPNPQPASFSLVLLAGIRGTPNSQGRREQRE
jgi:hypothetical protein